MYSVQLAIKFHGNVPMFDFFISLVSWNNDGLQDDSLPSYYKIILEICRNFRPINIRCSLLCFQERINHKFLLAFENGFHQSYGLACCKFQQIAKPKNRTVNRII